MSDDPVRTVVHTDRGDLPFQHYFVRDQCEPVVTGFSFEGISAARPNREVMGLLRQKAFGAIVVCPSNPFVSVDPILQLPGLWPALRDSPAPVVVVSPIVAGQAIKGPAAKMMSELGLGVSAVDVARHYCHRYPRLLDYFVIDESDATLAADIRAVGSGRGRYAHRYEKQGRQAGPCALYPAVERELTALVQALVPLKDLVRAKTRLAGLLTPFGTAGPGAGHGGRRAGSVGCPP